MKTVRTPTLEIAYEDIGPAGGPSVILLHGWPSDPHDLTRLRRRSLPMAVAYSCRGCAGSGRLVFSTRRRRVRASRRRWAPICAI